MSKFVLDTVVLRAFAFAHPQGVDILLSALKTSMAYLPPEVYNQDENSLPPNVSDEDLSELARGLRYAQRQVQTLPRLQGQRFQVRLQNATQIPRHIQAGSLFIEPLQIEELPRRESLGRSYGIGRGEAACLVLSERMLLTSVFLSSDQRACQAAADLSISFLTIPDILTDWVSEMHPPRELVQNLVDGMCNASFKIPESFYQQFLEML